MLKPVWNDWFIYSVMHLSAPIARNCNKASYWALTFNRAKVSLCYSQFTSALKAIRQNGNKKKSNINKKDSERFRVREQLFLIYACNNFYFAKFIFCELRKFQYDTGNSDAAFIFLNVCRREKNRKLTFYWVLLAIIGWLLFICNFFVPLPE